jgi:hypothetical protein
MAEVPKINTKIAPKAFSLMTHSNQLYLMFINYSQPEAGLPDMEKIQKDIDHLTGEIARLLPAATEEVHDILQVLVAEKQERNASANVAKANKRT